jgi:predicted esterase
LLPGRGGDGRDFAKIYEAHSELNDVLIIGLTPRGYGWYPSPMKYPISQTAKGIRYSIKKIEKAIKKLQKACKFTKDKTVLAGFSAGGVLAIQTAINSKEPYAGVIVHSGAIYEPNKMPTCRQTTPFLLTHGKQDDMFEWDERYVPMKQILLNLKYPVCCSEREGKHACIKKDREAAIAFLEAAF